MLERPLRKLDIAGSLALSPAAAALAMPITVANPSFEADAETTYPKRIRRKTTMFFGSCSFTPIILLAWGRESARYRLLVILFALFAAGGWSPEAVAQSCPSGALATSKSSALYLYFPTSSDATFPSYGGQPTSPVAAFDMAGYDGAIGTAQVRQRVLELVQAGYCEFDVDVKVATTTPSPAEARWQVVGIGADASAGPVGKAQAVDTGDTDPQDYGRVWVDELQSFGGPQLSGSNSTLERWATAIANLAAHESAHNYGAPHHESAPLSGEDPAANHFIADPAAGATANSIAATFNHFSDRVYERFGHDLGLNIKTLHNWDFVNPNSSNADSLVITLLSPASTLTLGWFYQGSLSPWTSPTVAKRAGTISFRGVAYNAFDLLFSTAKSWSGGANGVAPPAVKFHVGASFSESDPVIVYEATLRNGGTPLTLHPRMFGYDAGTMSPEYGVRFYNTQPERGELLLSNVEVLFLPRMLDLEHMVEGGELVALNGRPIQPFLRRPSDCEPQDGPTIHDSGLQGPVRVTEEPFALPVARLTDQRHLDEIVREGDCESGDGVPTAPGFGIPREVYCPQPGPVLSLFPATYTYVVATVTEPEAQQWDPVQGELITGPLETRLYFQVGGFVPDANDNGVDDLVDIRDGSSEDTNHNGIPDESDDSLAEDSRLALSAHFGIASPEGDTARVLDDGWSFDLGLEYRINPRFSLLGIIGGDRLEGTADLDILSFSVAGRIYLSSSGQLRPFAQVSFGSYDLDPGDLEAGFSTGVGLGWYLGGDLSLEGIYSYHRIETSGFQEDLEISTAKIGLRWQL